MEPDARSEKRARAIERLRDVPPGETVRMAFQLTDFARKLQRAAEDAGR